MHTLQPDTHGVLVWDVVYDPDSSLPFSGHNLAAWILSRNGGIIPHAKVGFGIRDDVTGVLRVLGGTATWLDADLNHFTTTNRVRASVGRLHTRGGHCNTRTHKHTPTHTDTQKHTVVITKAPDQKKAKARLPQRQLLSFGVCTKTQ